LHCEGNLLRQPRCEYSLKPGRVHPGAGSSGAQKIMKVGGAHFDQGIVDSWIEVYQIRTGGLSLANAGAGLSRAIIRATGYGPRGSNRGTNEAPNLAAAGD